MATLEELLDQRRQRRRELREELAPLEQDAASDEERAAAYLEALSQERAAVEAELVRLRRLRPDSRTWLAHEQEVGEPPTAAQRVERAERRLAGIDDEIERVSDRARAPN